MKGRQRITKIQLDDRTDEESTILGIVTSEADYKLSQLLNKKLKLAFKNNKNIDLKGVNGINMSFSRYTDITGAPEISYNLISNRSEKDYLLKKLKNIDYFLHVQSNHGKCNIEHLAGTLRGIEKITAVFKLNQEEIKDKNLDYLTL
jgi:hypothetical protein